MTVGTYAICKGQPFNRTISSSIMVYIIGYSEDALTYHVLTKRLDEVLELFEGKDRSNPSECALFYRPSFGRGGSKNNIGEFDAILATPRCMYLIESKMPHDEVFRKGRLRPCQERRYEITNWLAQRWTEGQDIETFYADNWREFEDKFEGRNLPEPNTGVLKRVCQVLDFAQEISADGNIRTVNVMLIFHRADEHVKPLDIPGFTVIPIRYKPVGESNFFAMGEE